MKIMDSSEKKNKKNISVEQQLITTSQKVWESRNYIVGDATIDSKQKVMSTPPFQLCLENLPSPGSKIYIYHLWMMDHKTLKQRVIRTPNELRRLFLLRPNKVIPNMLTK